jgi:alpha-tubulin suppressor-like RCC1 family protein
MLAPVLRAITPEARWMLILAASLSTLSACRFDRSGVAAQGHDSRLLIVDGGADLAPGLDLTPGVDLGPDAGPGPSCAIAGGYHHTCALSAGALWCWGAGTAGQLGVGETASHPTPALVAKSGWEGPTPGGQGDYSCAIKTDGSLWCWGANDRGQLGQGTTVSGYLLPTGVGTDQWLVAARGQEHTCGVRSDQTLWCWGRNDEGELGMGDLLTRTVPTRVAAGTTWKAISPGDGHTCGIQTDGTLWCWGRNSQGQLGLGPSAVKQHVLPIKVGSDTWAELACGQHYTCAVRTDGTLWCWGENSSKQLGLGDNAQRDEPTQVGSATGWVRVATSWFHTCGIQQDGRLWCWGRNVEGQLGTGDTTTRDTPELLSGTGWAGVAVCKFSTCAIRTDGSVWCTGENSSGQLGLGDTAPRNLLTELTF